MYPRGKLDIGWSDLGSALLATFRPADRAALRDRVERRWSGDADAFACLSVRTGWDLLLQALALPAGSEVLVSALTIRDMTKIIEAHGLVPIPIDLEMDRLALDMKQLRERCGDRARVILVAHVWGSLMPLDEVAAFAREQNLILVEDCAQSYAGDDYRGSDLVDVSMFSFGTIKTNTALGGAMFRVRDRDLLMQMRRIEAGYPLQSRSSYRSRIAKYALLNALARPSVFGLFYRYCKRSGKNHDAIISHALRGFPGDQLLMKIRRQPSAPLLSLLERRLTHSAARRIAERVTAAETAIVARGAVRVPGMQASRHTHWTFPVYVEHPDQVMAKLWTEGFDATRGASSLHVVDPPVNRPDLTTPKATAYMTGNLYLPVAGGMSARTIERLMRHADQADHLPNSTGRQESGLISSGSPVLSR